MNANLKGFIKKSVSENLPATNLINLRFTGTMGGWERNLSNNEFRRFTVTRNETENGLDYVLKARNLLIGNPKQREHTASAISVTLKSIEQLNDPILEDWLSTGSGKLQEIKDSIIKFIADDLIKLEQERHLKEFLGSL